MVDARQQIPEDIEKAKAYDNAVNGSPAPIEQDMTIYDLMEQYGVTPEDIQVVANEHPEMAQMIGGGPTLEALAASADKKKGKMIGGCGRGVSEIQSNSMVNKSDTTYNANAHKIMADESHRRSGVNSTTSGFARYIGLEATGSWISIDFDNEAYNKARKGTEYEKTNEFAFGVRPGVCISVDEIRDRDVRKSKATSEKEREAGGTPGGIHGHVAIMGHDGKYHADGEQSSINFTRYGEQYHLSYPTDAVVPAEYCNMIVDQAKTRQSDPNYRYPDDVRKRTTPQGGYRRPAPQKQAGRQQSRSNNNSGTNRSGRRSGVANRGRGGR